LTIILSKAKVEILKLRLGGEKGNEEYAYYFSLLV